MKKNSDVFHTDDGLKNSDLKEFQAWIKETNQSIDDWTEWLYFHAKKEGKTYSGAMNLLRKNRPEAPRSFKATGVQSFTGVIQAMFDDATLKVRNEALNKEINND